MSIFSKLWHNDDLAIALAVTTTYPSARNELAGLVEGLRPTRSTH